MGDYGKFFICSERLFAKSPNKQRIDVLDPDRMAEFIETVANDVEMDRDLKMAVLIMASTGARVSEAIALTGSAIGFDGFLRLPVLKKRREISREAKLHPAAHKWMLVQGIGPEERLVRRHRSNLHLAIKRHFTPWVSCHSFRHSYVSRLIQSGVPALQVAKMLKLSNTNIVLAYTHCSRRNLEEVWIAA